jgi:hypothetical protein
VSWQQQRSIVCAHQTNLEPWDDVPACAILFKIIIASSNQTTYQQQAEVAGIACRRGGSSAETGHLRMAASVGC